MRKVASKDAKREWTTPTQRAYAAFFVAFFFVAAFLVVAFLVAVFLVIVLKAVDACVNCSAAPCGDQPHDSTDL